MLIAIGAIVLIVGARIIRRTQIHSTALVLAGLDIGVQMLVVVTGLACVFSPGVLVNGFDFATGQSWHDLFFALPLAMLAYTGLETVANLAEETREPGRVLPRSLFSSIGLVVIMTVLIAVVGALRLPGRGRLHRPRRRLAPGADRRHRDRVRRAPARDDRRHAAHRRRAVRRADPVRGCDDGDHRVHPARALDGRARDAAARVRPPRAAHARLARGARSRPGRWRSRSSS